MPSVLNACRSAGAILPLDCDTAPAKASLLVMTCPLLCMREITTSRIATKGPTHVDGTTCVDERFGVYFTLGPALLYYKLSCDARFDPPIFGGEMPTALDVAHSGKRTCAWHTIHVCT